MIKLKNILFESYTNVDFKKFDTLLSNGTYIETKIPIFRGLKSASSNNIDTFSILNIRKDRKPRDSNKFSNIMYNTYVSSVFYNIPQRDEILFCSLNMNVALQYATDTDFIYIILPTKQSNIIAYEKDSLSILDMLVISSHINEFINYIKENNFIKFNYLYKFLTLYAEDKYQDAADYFVDVQENIYDNIIDFKHEITDMQQKQKHSNIQIIDRIEVFLNKLITIIRYISTLDNKLNFIKNNETLDNISVTDGTEIWITDKTYCLVNMNFYNDYKKWKTNNDKTD